MTRLGDLLAQRASLAGLAYQDMRAPAGVRELADLAAAFPAPVPAEMLDLLGLADGQPRRALPLFGRWRLMGIAEMLEARAVLDDLAAAGDFDGDTVSADRGIRSAWWHTGWLPFAANGAGDHLCLDLAPDAAGVPGQVIEFLHEEGRRRRLGASLYEWIAAA